jgi:DNA modification methylase
MAALARTARHDAGLLSVPLVRPHPDGRGLEIIDGEHRWRAAQEAGLKEIRVLVIDCTDEEARARTVAMNQIHGEPDPERQAALLAELARCEAEAVAALAGEPDIPLAGVLGFDADEWKAALDAGSGAEENFDAEEAMAQAETAAGPTRVQPGELWQLGKHHRLLCGDCTVPENWERLMAGDIAQAVVTDPPYAVSYCGGRAAQEERIAKARRGVDGPSDTYWDELTPTAYLDLLEASLSHAYRWSDEQAPLYLWFASARIRQVIEALAATGWEERNLIVWVKNIGAGALFAQYKHRYEPQFYAFKKGHAPRWHGPTNETTVWEHDKPARNDLHPTMKPLPLIERAICNSTRPGQLVVDPFVGSGTAIIAAERTGRRCYGMDLDARYCSVALARWEAETGMNAVREEDQGA